MVLKRSEVTCSCVTSEAPSSRRGRSPGSQDAGHQGPSPGQNLSPHRARRCLSPAHPPLSQHLVSVPVGFLLWVSRDDVSTPVGCTGPEAGGGLVSIKTILIKS